MGWLRQLKESYWDARQVDDLDAKLEPLRQSDTEAAQKSPVERFVEVERDLGRMTLLMQSLVEACVRKGLLSHEEIAAILDEVNLAEPEENQWGAAATARPSLPLLVATNGHTASSGVTTLVPRRSDGEGDDAEIIDDFDSFGSDEEHGSEDATDVETADESGADAGFDFGGGEIDRGSAIDVGGQGDGVESIPRTAPFPKKKKQKSSALRQIIGVVVAGPVGLALGYFVLLWIGGPEKDFLELGKKLPAFMVPASFHAEPSATATTNATSVPIATNNSNGTGDLPHFNFDNTDESVPGSQDTPTVPTIPGTGGGSDPFTTLDTPTTKTDDDPLSGLEPMDDDPLKIAPPIKPPTPTRKPKVIPVSGVSAVEAATLGDALKAANLAVLDLNEGSLADADANTKKKKAAAYGKFCDMAWALTFVDGDPVKDQLETRRPAAVAVARTAVESGTTFADVGEIGRRWWSFDKRPTNGIFLTGIVREVTSVGGLHATIVDLGKNAMNEDVLVKIVTANPPAVDVDDRVAVLGAIVDEPGTNLDGFEGDDTRVVWSENVLKVEPPLGSFE